MHVIADAAVSILVVAALLLARVFGWVWLDPAVGLVGMVVILSWSYGLLRAAGAVLLDMTPDEKLKEAIRSRLETNGDFVSDLHLWRVGPGIARRWRRSSAQIRGRPRSTRRNWPIWQASVI